MTNMTHEASGKLLDLARRVEHARCYDRMLDVAIARAATDLGPWSTSTDEQLARTIAVVPDYSTSIDAAARLIPKGWSISMHLSENGLHPIVKLGRSHPTNATIAQEGHTLPLTICVAALRARAHTLSGDQ